jgi:WD40 repeat protein
LVETGQKLKSFTDLHGNAEVTCMEFDETNTRLYTGGTDGKIKQWDFHGNCYHILDAGNGVSCEINQILPIKRRIVSVGWSK